MSFNAGFSPIDMFYHILMRKSTNISFAEPVWDVFRITANCIQIKYNPAFDKADKIPFDA